MGILLEDQEFMYSLSSDEIITKVTSSLSIMGSIYIIQDVLRDPKKWKESIYHHIMLGLSTCDIISSIAFHFLHTWPQPKGYAPGAYGTMATCDAVGFIGNTALIGAALYNCSLGTYFLVKVKYSWTRSRAEARKKWFHIVPWAV